MEQLFTTENIERLLLLRALNDPEATKLYNLWSGGRIISDMMANSPEAQMERAKADMIVGIVNWVKAHPTASSDEVAAEISRQVAAVLLKAY